MRSLLVLTHFVIHEREQTRATTIPPRTMSSRRAIHQAAHSPETAPPAREAERRDEADFAKTHGANCGDVTTSGVTDAPP
jgi:hypothetical protein